MLVTLCFNTQLPVEGETEGNDLQVVRLWLNYRDYLRDHPELFSYRCYSSRDLRPIASSVQRNSYLLDCRECAVALNVLDDLANLLLKLFFAAH